MDEQVDLLAVGGSNLQGMYNIAVMDAVNEELGIAQQRVRCPALPCAALVLPCPAPPCPDLPALILPCPAPSRPAPPRPAPPRPALRCPCVALLSLFRLSAAAVGWSQLAQGHGRHCST